MNIKDLFGKGKLVYSFEIFPPKADSPISTLYDALGSFKELKPDYISVTYGTSGEENQNNTIEISRTIKEKYNIEPLMHLTAIHSDKETVKRTCEKLKAYGIKNVLALRGDVHPGVPVSKDFKYASDLITYLKEVADFNIAAACYPEGHFESKSLEQDLQALKKKVDLGVSHLNTQLFFENQPFYRFKELCAKNNIDVPIQAGIMPLVRKKQIERIVSLSGAKIPSKISRMFARFGNDERALYDAGIAYATEQIIDLISYGVDGIHLYSMNKPDVAARITENIRSFL